MKIKRVLRSAQGARITDTKRSKTKVDSCMDALRISPHYASLDWQGLDANDPKDWPKAADVVRDRLDGRFLRFASLSDKYSGFVVLAIDSLLAETIQQFVDGVTDGQGRSKRMVMRFLEGTRFQPDFDAKAREAF